MRLLPIIILLIFLLPAIGFILLIIKLATKTKTSYWKGEVIDKLENKVRQDDDKTSTFLTLVVNTNEGVIRKVAVTKNMYDSCNIGDTLEKPKGALNPIKI